MGLTGTFKQESGRAAGNLQTIPVNTEGSSFLVPLAYLYTVRCANWGDSNLLNFALSKRNCCAYDGVNLADFKLYYYLN